MDLKAIIRTNINIKLGDFSQEMIWRLLGPDSKNLEILAWETETMIEWNKLDKICSIYGETVAVRKAVKTLEESIHFIAHQLRIPEPIPSVYQRSPSVRTAKEKPAVTIPMAAPERGESAPRIVVNILGNSFVSGVRLLEYPRGDFPVSGRENAKFPNSKEFILKSTTLSEQDAAVPDSNLVVTLNTDPYFLLFANRKQMLQAITRNFDLMLEGLRGDAEKHLKFEVNLGKFSFLKCDNGGFQLENAQLSVDEFCYLSPNEISIDFKAYWSECWVRGLDVILDKLGYERSPETKHTVSIYHKLEAQDGKSRDLMWICEPTKVPNTDSYRTETFRSKKTRVFREMPYIVNIHGDSAELDFKVELKIYSSDSDEQAETVRKRLLNSFRWTKGGYEMVEPISPATTVIVRVVTTFVRDDLKVIFTSTAVGGGKSWCGVKMRSNLLKEKMKPNQRHTKVGENMKNLKKLFEAAAELRNEMGSPPFNTATPMESEPTLPPPSSSGSSPDNTHPWSREFVPYKNINGQKSPVEIEAQSKPINMSPASSSISANEPVRSRVPRKVVIKLPGRSVPKTKENTKIKSEPRNLKEAATNTNKDLGPFATMPLSSHSMTLLDTPTNDTTPLFMNILEPVRCRAELSKKSLVGVGGRSISKAVPAISTRGPAKDNSDLGGEEDLMYF